MVFIWALLVLASPTMASAGLLLDLINESRGGFPGGPDLNNVPIFRGSPAPDGSLSGSRRISLNDDFGARSNSATFTTSIEAELVDRYALTGAYPVTSSSPSLIYRWDPNLEVHVPEETALGPIYSERFLTLGRHKFALGAVFTSFDYDRLDGHQFEELNSVSRPGNLNDVFVSRFDVSLSYWVLALTATYGLTQTWDVSVLLPLVKVDAEATREVELIELGPSGGEVHSFDSERLLKSLSGPRAEETEYGVGDLVLRTKKEILSGDAWGAGAGAGLTIPTGNAEKLLGGDSLVLDLAFFLSGSMGSNVYPHLNMGLDFKLTDTGELDELFEESAGSAEPVGSPSLLGARWVAGFDVKVHEVATVVLDVRGFSDIAEREQLRLLAGSGPPAPGPEVIAKREVREDLFDFSAGIKGRIGERAIAFANVLLPINRSTGARPRIVPTLGIELYL